jgi:hypothetical protein
LNHAFWPEQGRLPTFCQRFANATLREHSHSTTARFLGRGARPAPDLTYPDPFSGRGPAPDAAQSVMGESELEAGSADETADTESVGWALVGGGPPLESLLAASGPVTYVVEVNRCTIYSRQRRHDDSGAVRSPTDMTDLRAHNGQVVDPPRDLAGPANDPQRRLGACSRTECATASRPDFT